MLEFMMDTMDAIGLVICYAAIFSLIFSLKRDAKRGQWQYIMVNICLRNSLFWLTVARNKQQMLRC